MSTLPPPPDRLCFGRFELRPLEHRLLADGEPVALGGRAFELLLALAQRPGQLVTRNALIARVRPSRVVEENNLSVQINALRKVLGDAWLITVPGHGYRFVAPLTAPAPTEPPAPPTPVAPRTNLPTLQPLLIGRSDDLAALGTLIDQHRLVTVVGAGGMGKTRLVQALMHLRANTYPQGVCWVELGPVTSADALPVAVAAALGLQLAPGDALAHLTHALVGLQLLIALDNAEHLLDGAALVAQALLDAAPGLRLVVTSQAPLRLAHERVLRLGPLAVPQAPLPASQAQAFGAIALFCERAAAADHRFVLADADVPALIELCQRLDGVALALELAAARAPALGIAQLLASLADRLQVFSSNRNRLAPARQQSLRAALEWSVGLLAPAEAQLFRRLAVVAGSASLTLVQHLGRGADPATTADPWALVDQLDQLIQRSLVEVVHPEGSAAPRYRLLESPRALALEHLAAAGEEDTWRLWHVHGVLAELDAAHAALHAGTLGMQARRQLAELDLDNARAALAHLGPADLPALELAVASAMMPAVLNGERLALADRCEQLIAATTVSSEPPPPARVYRAWREISVALANLRPQRSRAAASQALSLARKMDAPHADRYPLYDALCALAHMVVEDEGAVRAEQLLREAHTIEDPAWPAVRRLPGVRVQASIATARGDLQEALRLYRRLLDLGRAAGDPGLTTRLNIANAELAAGDAAAAVATGTQVLAHWPGMRNHNLLLFAHINLAAAHLTLQQAALARQHLQAALPAAMRVPLQAWCIDYLAELAALEGRLEAAARLVGAATARCEALAETRQVNEQRAHARTLACLRSALGAPVLAHWVEQGRLLSDADVALHGLAVDSAQRRQ